LIETDRKLARVAVITGFLVIATFVAGKAARDATVLANFNIRMLPTFVGIGAFVTIPIVLVVGRRLATKGPAWLFPRINTSSATLLVIEWLMLPHWNKAAAAITYVHLAALGPVLVSGFWSTINERLDPRAVKRAIASVGLGTTLGGVAGGLIAQLVAAELPASSILLVVAGLQLASAVFLASLGSHAVQAAPDPNPSIWNGTRAIARSPLLRNIAALIIFGAMGAAALDYVFKADLVREGAPLKGLALYYTVTSVITALVQLVATDKTIARLGAAGGAVALPLTVTGFAGLMLAIPSAAVTAIGRGAELVVRSSIYRAGYELLFAPLPPAEKRPAKVVLDVGAERVGDILGSQLISLILFAAPLARSAIVIAALVLGLLAIGAAVGLRRKYIAALEESLLAAQPTPVQLTTTLQPTGSRARPAAPSGAPARDAIAELVEELRSGDRDRVAAALATPLVPELVPHVLPLLGWEPVSELATSALRAIAPRTTGVLVDALLDPDTDFTVRRRLPAILEAGDPERAQWGLWRALSNERFEVRYRAGKALGRLHEANVRLTAKPDEIYDAVVREVSVDVRIWRGRSLLDGYQGPESEMRLYRALEERSATALDHVFTLLGLVLPAQPLKVALAALSTDNLALHGTALEYLESVLPPRIRVPLWPFLELEANTTPSPRQPHDVVAALEAHPSILAYLEDPDDPGN